mgnify:CR=1 FL=1
MAQTWFITGAARGLGFEVARAALAAGNNVVAAARNPEAVVDAFGGRPEMLLPVPLDVTSQDQAARAVAAATERFGGIDVLVNNAGYGQLGFFEENTLEDARAQIETNLFGTMILSWAVLPIMRRARKGHIFNISSVAGVRGSEMGSLYSASKFAVAGFSESLAAEVSQLGIAITIVEPGLFRTDFLNESSIRFGASPIADYADRSGERQSLYRGLAGQQSGDPAKLARALIRLSQEPNPPLHFAAGPDAVETVEAKIEATRADLEAWRTLSVATDRDG